MSNLGIYIHIPFCLRKCPYCDFYSVAEAKLGKTETDAMRGRFVKALCMEIESGSRKYGMKARAGEDRQVDTIYIGGGTPSLLMPHELEKILETIRKNFKITENVEISMECNPATATGEKLAAYCRAGVNRLSIGAQSFDDGVLRTLGRLHTAADTVRTVGDARNAGFRNLSLDLMFAIPGQTDEIWEDTLKRALSLRPEHISFYSLEFMEGTPFTERLEKGEMRETDAGADRHMYERGLEIMAEAGLIQYEISNGARGMEHVCRHNMKYWSLEEYLGFGPSAHSYMTGADGRGIRFNNVSSIEKYLSSWENPGDCGQRAVEAFCENSLEDDVCEYIFTGLRKNTGIDLEDFRKRFGKDIREFYGETVMKELKEYAEGGFASVTDDNIRLTVKGMNISNRIMALFV